MKTCKNVKKRILGITCQGFNVIVDAWSCAFHEEIGWFQMIITEFTKIHKTAVFIV